MGSGFLVVSSNRRRGNTQPETDEVPPEYKEKLDFEGDRALEQLPRKAVESSLQIFKTCLDTFLCNLLLKIHFSRGVGL